MATAKNPITGDSIATKPTNDAYRNNFDAIFRKQKPEADAGNGESPVETEAAAKRDPYKPVQWPFPTVNGERQ